jgi:tRNA dimethylallyltransferase
MFADGLVAETQSLLKSYGDACEITPIHSLGYKQTAQHLRGELTLEQAVAAAQQGHRNYAKRQMTWFRREPDVSWLTGFGDNPAIGAEASELIARSGNSKLET